MSSALVFWASPLRGLSFLPVPSGHRSGYRQRPFRLQIIEQQSKSTEQMPFFGPQLDSQAGSPVQSLSSQSMSVSQSLSTSSSQISGVGSQLEAQKRGDVVVVERECTVNRPPAVGVADVVQVGTAATIQLSDDLAGIVRHQRAAATSLGGAECIQAVDELREWAARRRSESSGR